MKQQTVRFLIASALIALCGAASAQSRKQETGSHAPAMVGKYPVPTLPGWKRTLIRRPPRTFKRTRNGVVKVYHVPLLEQVVYEKTVGTAQLRLSFDAVPADHTVTRADLSASLRVADRVMGATPLKNNSVPPEPRAEAFGKRPAVTRQYALKDSHGLPVETRERYFGSGKMLYIQDLTVRGIPTPQARAEADTAWKKLTNALHSLP